LLLSRRVLLHRRALPRSLHTVPLPVSLRDEVQNVLLLVTRRSSRAPAGRQGWGEHARLDKTGVFLLESGLTAD
jgi:hypothetical protein